MIARPRLPYSDVELATIERMARALETASTIARVISAEFGVARTTSGVRQLVERNGWNPKTLRNTGRVAAPLELPAATMTRHVLERDLDGDHVDVIAPDETGDESPEAFWARVTGRTRRACAIAAAEKYAVVRIATDLPIALTISSDWHVSTTSATDLDGLRDYAVATAATPGAYALAVGDMTDNPIKHRPSAVRDVPDDLRALDVILSEFRGRMLGMTSGNHDDWTFAFAGLDSLRSMAARRRIHYAPDEIVYVVEIVSPRDPATVTARWVIATRHKYRRNSALNPLHACWRWLEEMSGQWPHDTDGRTLLPDVLAIGDNHIAEIGVQSVPRGDVVGLRMGAWQVSTGFARGLGFKNYRPTAPTVILHPTRAVQPTPFADYRTAYDVLRAMRGLGARGGSDPQTTVAEPELVVDDAAGVV